MRQLKNCKKGHFVKYKDVICQVNCFYTSLGKKHATLIQAGEPEEKKQIFTPLASEKVEYIGITARGRNGEIWITTKRDPLAPFNTDGANL